MVYRSLAVAVLTLAGVGVADAQSVYVAPGGVYAGPGANVYVTPPANGAYSPPAVVYGPPGYPGPSYAAPPPANGNGYSAAPAYVAPGEVYAPAYGAPAPAYTPLPAYDEPLSAYGAAPRVYLRGPAYVRERIYVAPLDDVPRPPAPVPYGWRGR
jgi:hypothetical protein